MSPADKFKPEIVVLFCQNCVKTDLALADSIRQLEDTLARFVVMPCSSKVNVRQLMGILDKGIDGVQIIKCPDTDCRFFDGKITALNHVEHVHGLLKEIGFPDIRVQLETGNTLTGKELFDLSNTYGRNLRELGPNPLKKATTQGQKS